MEPFDFHTHHTTKNGIQIIDLTTKKIINNSQYFFAGLHPWWVDQISIDQFKKIWKELKLDPRCLGLGEIGVDRSRKSNIETQLIVFDQLLALAKEQNIKHIVIHCVQAYSDIIYYVKKNKYNGNLYFHDFNANEKTLDQLLQLNSYFSVGAKLFSATAKIKKTLPLIPLTRIFFETDDQLKYSIDEIYHQAASLLNLETDVLINQSNLNFRNCFLLKDI